MIFEIFGTIGFDDPRSPSVVNPLFRDGIYRRAGNQRLERKVKGLGIVCVSRSKAEEYVFEDKDFLMVCVGEPRSRGPRSIRLNARKIHDLHGDKGDDFIDDIKGNFQLVLYDLAQNKISLINSRFGVSPFYYSFRRGILMFSSNLRVIAAGTQDRRDLDTTAIAEYSLFGYPLGDRTIFREVRSMRPAERIVVRRDSLKGDIYWNHRDLITQDAYPADEALSIGAELFRQTVDTYAAEPEKICMSLTAGFDGRTILSVTDKKPDDCLFYSFGIKGSLNVSIPQQICQHLKLKYRPVWLDEEYEKAFNTYARQAVEFSDCLATFERANYPFAFRKLSDFSSIMVTGIFGSELMRTFQNVSIGYMITKNYVDLVRADDKKIMLLSLISRARDSYYDPTIYDPDNDELTEHILGECFDNYSGITENERFFLFLLHEGARKYFGGEVHMERIYGTNRFPFLDDDFVEFIFRSPFSGVKSNPLRPSIKQRFTSQYFYARIMEKFMPRLLNFSTDHGYPPRYIIAKAPLLKIAPSLFLKRVRQLAGRNREFKIEEWSDKFYQEYFKLGAADRDFFSRKLNADFESGKWKTNRFAFAKASSLALYLDIVHGS